MNDPATMEQLAVAVAIGLVLGVVAGYAACAWLRAPLPRIGADPADEGESMLDVPVVERRRAGR